MPVERSEHPQDMGHAHPGVDQHHERRTCNVDDRVR